MDVNACPVAGRRTHWRCGLFLAMIFLVYVAANRGLGSDDNLALRYLPLSILREGNFDLNEFSFLYANRVLLSSIIYQDGHFLSFVPVGPALLALPFYLLPALAGLDAASPWLAYLERVAAAGIAALSALFIFLTLARLVPIRTAFLATTLYAFGTATFGISSQALWPVGSAQLLLAIALYCLTRGRTEPHWTSYAAVPLAWAVMCRPSSALVALILALYVLRHRRQQLATFLLLTLPAVAFLLTYNGVYFGDPFLPPGYVSAGGHVLGRWDNLNTPLLKGLVGLLISPAVGFLVFSPIFILALRGVYRRWRAADALTPYLAGAVLAVLVLDSKLNMWWGGYFLGPRYVIEVAPLLAYFLAFGLPHRGRVWEKCLVGLLAVWSLYANGLVALAFDGSWDHRAELWSWSNNPLMYYSRQSWQRGFEVVRALGETLKHSVAEVPDSRNRRGLEAELEIDELPTQLATHAFKDVQVSVKNTGRARWLRLTPDGHGIVRFGWRWRTMGASPQEALEGRGPLLRGDLWPGQQVRQTTRIWAPAEPGGYELELGMVSESVAWFGRWREPTRRVKVEVTGAPRCPFERGIATLQDPIEPPLRLRLIADRTILSAAEVFSARLNIDNPGPGRVLYPLIVLRRPSGAYSYLDFEDKVFQPLCPEWIEPRWPLFIDRGYYAVDYPILSLWVKDMPAGVYTLHVLYFRVRDSAIWLAGQSALDFVRLP